MQNFDSHISFRAYRQDRERLIEVANKWQIEEAEVARRALRAGLEVLHKCEIPGTRKTRTETE